MSTKVTIQYHIKNDIDKETGRISLQSKIAGEFTEEIYESKDKQLIGALVRLGWLPPDDVTEVMSILNDLIRIYKGEESFANQGQAMDGFSMLANFRGTVDTILNIESPNINRYII